jgi:hypothetical protein
MKNKNFPPYKSSKEIFKDAEPCDLFERVKKEIEEENAENLIDMDRLKQLRAWSKINNEIITTIKI